MKQNKRCKEVDEVISELLHQGNKLGYAERLMKRFNETPWWKLVFTMKDDIETYFRITEYMTLMKKEREKNKRFKSR